MDAPIASNAGTREHGKIGEERLLLMTALLIADDLWDATSGDQPASAA
jgi:hypothetical protein